MPKLAVICPVYNEAENIKLLVSEFIKLNNNLKKKYSVKFIFVNDGSTDQTKKIILDESKKFNNIDIINFTKNFGYSSAVAAGLEKINADFYACIDGDLQKDPIHILSMLEIIENKLDVVQMVTNKDKNYESKLKTKLSILYYALLNYVSETKTVSGASDFWLIRKTVRDKLLLSPSFLNFVRASFVFLKFKTSYINYNAMERKLGISKFNLKKQIELAICGILLFAKKRYFLLLFFLPLFFIFFTYCTYLISIKMFFSNITVLNTLLLFVSLIPIFLITHTVFMINKMYKKIQNKPIYVIEKI